MSTVGETPTSLMRFTNVVLGDCASASATDRELGYDPAFSTQYWAGGHPRAMAVDVALKDASGALPDMGTPFDFLAENGDAAHNPAHREFKGHSEKVMENRRLLDSAMLGAAADLGIPLIGLPAEWWDFRLPADIYNQHEPLSDAVLPADMRMTDVLI